MSSLANRTLCPLCGGKLAEYQPGCSECPIRERIIGRGGKEIFDCHYRINMKRIDVHILDYEQFIVFPFKIESYEENIFDIYKYTYTGVRYVTEVCGTNIFPWRDKTRLLKKLKTYTVMS